MKKVSVAFVFLLSILSCFGQEVAVNKSWSAYFTPTSILNPAYPAIHFGVEKELNTWSALFEAGVLLPSSLYKNNTSALGLQDFASKNNGIFFKVEGRKYWNKYLYTGLNAQLLFNNYERTDTFDATPELTSSLNGFFFCSTCVEETYSIRKKMIGITLKVGMKVDLKKNFYLDGYFGLGMNYHINEHSMNSDLHKNPAVADGLLSYYDMHYPGKFIFRLPVPSFGLRVGYSF